MSEAFVLPGVRAPFARYAGSLSHLRTDVLLGTTTLVPACHSLGVPLEGIVDITTRYGLIANEGIGEMGRRGALAGASPDSVLAVTVNRFCASSLTGASNIAHAIRARELRTTQLGRHVGAGR